MSGKTSCADITPTDLAGIDRLAFLYIDIAPGQPSLNIVDHGGLSNGDFAGLTGLTSLKLEFNRLTTLPADIFSGLSALETLRLKNNQLTTLPSGVFAGLTSLTTLNLLGNPLPASLPASLFADVPRNAITFPTGTTINAAVPTTAGTIANITDLVVNGSPQTVDVADKFSDTGDTLTFSVMSGDTNIATVGVSGSTITITPVAIGTTTITVTATDTAEQTVTQTFMVSVNAADSTAPIITLTGDNPQTIELGAGYTELGASADGGSTVSIDSSAFTDAVGTYIITYTATDGTNPATVTRTVNVVDTTAPMISISLAAVTATAGTAIADITVSSTGGTVASYSIDPTIGNGLSFSTATGTISGAPTAAAGSITYTITATNASDTDTATVAITVNAPKLDTPT